MSALFRTDAEGSKSYFKEAVQRNNRECRRSNVSMCKLRVRKILTFIHMQKYIHIQCITILARKTGLPEH